MAADQSARRIAVIGGGIAGLSAAYDLADKGFAVDLFEGDSTLGGLAAGFRGRAEWDWPLEKFYHHLFTNDDAILDLCREIGAEELLWLHRPTTVMHYQGQNYPFDTPLRLLQFPHLPMAEKVRMGAVLAYLKYHPRPPWKDFDGLLADRWLEHWMGARGYRTLWQPMLEGKFGPHFQDVNLAWFWARIYKRTPQLYYFRGGFQAFVDALAKRVERMGVKIHLGQRVQELQPLPEGGWRVRLENEAEHSYAALLSTTSPHLMARIAPDLPETYLGKLTSLQNMGAVVLTVALDRPLLTDTYWVNVPKAEGLPYLALVEHTNMIDPAHYAGDHLLYIGDYLIPEHRRFSMDDGEILAEFLPTLSRFNPDFREEWVTGYWGHRAVYAQPVPVRNYLEKIPSIKTPLPGLYFASMSQVYPWDRGTNYAVEIGRRAASLMTGDLAETPF